MEAASREKRQRKPCQREPLTDKLVRNLEPPGHGQRIVHDRDVKGFGVRITAGGTRAFVITYWNRGRPRRFTIGNYPAWTMTAARSEAKALRCRIDRGEDIMAASRGAPTVRDLAEKYRMEYLPRKRPHSQRRDWRMLESDVLPAIGRLKVAEITFSHIYAIHRTVTKRAPIRANRVLAMLSKMFALAIRPYEMCSGNPCIGIQRNPESPRHRFLSAAELARLGTALAAEPNQTAAAVIRFLSLTGARLGEVLAATWSQIDFDAGAWTKPAAATKQGRMHRVVLSAPALELLACMYTEASRPDGFVFAGAGGRPLSPPHRCWRRVVQAAGIEDVRLHDLRHTYASIAVSGGASLALIGGLLGHTQAQTTMRYSHLLDEPQRAVTDRVGAYISAVTAGHEPPSAEVVNLSAKR